MRLTIPILLILTMFSQTGFGQETAAEPAADNYEAQAKNYRSLNSTSRTKQTISIDFPGGTIGDYIDLVKKDAESLNLIVTDGAKDLVLPKIALKNVPVDVSVKCIEQCFDPNETVVKVSSENQGIQIIQATMTSRKEVDVINVKRLFSDKKMTEETFMQAVEIGLTMYSQQEKLKLKIQFHKETGLLFLSGLRQEIQLVQQIVSQLQNNSFGPGGMGGMSGGPGYGAGAGGGAGMGMGAGGGGAGGMGGPGAGAGGGAGDGGADRFGGGSGAEGMDGGGGRYRPVLPRPPKSRTPKSNANFDPRSPDPRSLDPRSPGPLPAPDSPAPLDGPSSKNPFGRGNRGGAGGSN